MMQGTKTTLQGYLASINGRRWQGEDREEEDDEEEDEVSSARSDHGRREELPFPSSGVREKVV